MSSRPTSHYDTTASTTGGGCFSLPVVAVLFVGALFILVFGNTPGPIDVYANEGATNGGGIASLFTPEVQYWEARILEWAGSWSLDPNLVATVMQIESCGDPFAKSYAGAMGLFQVMPYHFQAGESAFTPAVNAQRGLAYLRRAYEAHGSIRLALAGYNGGITGASRPESAWSDQTTRYVYWGTNIYEDARQGRTQSATLLEWLGRGGASLCAQARGRLGLEP